MGGVEMSRSWKDWSRRVQPQFGKMRGLWRTHHAMSEAGELIHRGAVDKGLAHLIQVLPFGAAKVSV